VVETSGKTQMKLMNIIRKSNKFVKNSVRSFIWTTHQSN